MESLRNASRNTMFESWLESAMAGTGAGRAPSTGLAAQVCSAAWQPWSVSRATQSHLLCGAF